MKAFKLKAFSRINGCTKYYNRNECKKADIGFHSYLLIASGFFMFVNMGYLRDAIVLHFLTQQINLKAFHIKGSMGCVGHLQDQSIFKQQNGRHLFSVVFCNIFCYTSTIYLPIFGGSQKASLSANCHTPRSNYYVRTSGAWACICPPFITQNKTTSSIWQTWQPKRQNPYQACLAADFGCFFVRQKEDVISSFR